MMGNKDASSAVKYYFQEPFVTKRVRIYPVVDTFPVCLRMELYGCDPNPGNNTTVDKFLLYLKDSGLNGIRTHKPALLPGQRSNQLIHQANSWELVICDFVLRS